MCDLYNLNCVYVTPTFFARVAEALILGTMMVGQATAFAPNYNKAVLAAARVFRLLDRRPLIDSRGQSGLRLVSTVPKNGRNELNYVYLCAF